jgi:hypothetical protein
MQTVRMVNSVEPGLPLYHTRLAVDGFSTYRITAWPARSEAAYSKRQTLVTPWMAVLFQTAARFSEMGSRQSRDLADRHAGARDSESLLGVAQNDRKFITSHSVTGTILYYPRPLLRPNPCQRKGSQPSLPHREEQG